MITCSSKAQPKAFFTIIHNGTIYISGIEETHTIPNVNWNAAGYYTCVASNNLGRNPSNSKFLNVKGKAASKTSLLFLFILLDMYVSILYYVEKQARPYFAPSIHLHCPPPPKPDHVAL